MPGWFMRSCDVEVARLAARQQTMVSVEQLHAAGASRAAIKWRANEGRLHLVTRGLYSTVPSEVRPPLAQEAAALLALPGAVLSHRSAAALWGLTRRDPTTVDVITPTRKRGRPGLRVHTAADLRTRDVRTRESLTLTSPYRSILDLAPLMSERELQYATSEGLSRKLITDDQASTLVEQPAITRSEAERLFAELVNKAGLDQPRQNARLDGYEVDFFWPNHDLVVEIDGFQFHGHRLQFERDREKDLALAREGVRVVRLSWRQLVEEPELVVASLARLL